MSKPIKDSTIRSEVWTGIVARLEELLRDIPLTSSQRDEIQDLIWELGDKFQEANKD